MGIAFWGVIEALTVVRPALPEAYAGAMRARLICLRRGFDETLGDLPTKVSHAAPQHLTLTFIVQCI
jgi:hypothetical protein